MTHKQEMVVGITAVVVGAIIFALLVAIVFHVGRLNV